MSRRRPSAFRAARIRSWTSAGSAAVTSSGSATWAMGSPSPILSAVIIKFPAHAPLAHPRRTAGPSRRILAGRRPSGPSSADAALPEGPSDRGCGDAVRGGRRAAVAHPGRRAAVRGDDIGARPGRRDGDGSTGRRVHGAGPRRLPGHGPGDGPLRVRGARWPFPRAALAQRPSDAARTRDGRERGVLPPGRSAAHHAAHLMHLGAHVPITGGVFNAPGHAQAIGAEAIQIFTRNQMQWACRPLREDDAAAFREAVAKSGVKRVLTHGSYLMNLASPNPEFLARSRDCLVTEIERCHQLAIPYVVLHPGA